MLDEDNVLNETPKSSSINLPDETAGAPQLERSTEVAKTQTATAKSVVRNLGSHPFKASSLFRGEKRQLKLDIS